MPFPPHGTLAYFGVGLLMLAVAVALTRRRWRWVWLVALVGLCWMAALPHGM